jgi:hypothetical protein
MPVNYSSSNLSTTGNITVSSATFTNSSIEIGNEFDNEEKAFGIVQFDRGQNFLSGSLGVYGGLYAPISVYKPIPPLTPGYLGGNIPIGYGTHKQIQRLRIGGFAFNEDAQIVEANVNFILGDLWPTENAPVTNLLQYRGVSVEVLLELEMATNCTVIWDIVDEWYNQPPPTFSENTKHLVLLRSLGFIVIFNDPGDGSMPTGYPTPFIQGHYIGQKTN